MRKPPPRDEKNPSDRMGEKLSPEDPTIALGDRFLNFQLILEVGFVLYTLFNDILLYSITRYQLAKNILKLGITK